MDTIIIELPVPDVKLPEVISVAWLMERSACPSGVAAFIRCFPEGYAVRSVSNMEKAVNSNLDIDWLIQEDGGGQAAWEDIENLDGIAKLEEVRNAFWSLPTGRESQALAAYKREARAKYRGLSQKRKYKIPAKLTSRWLKDHKLTEILHYFPHGVILTAENVNYLFEQGLTEYFCGVDPKLKEAHGRYSRQFTPRQLDDGEEIKFWIGSLAVPV